MRAENDRLEGRATAAERNATSLEAQRKTAVAEKAKFQKRVCTYLNKNVLCLAYLSFLFVGSIFSLIESALKLESYPVLSHDFNAHNKTSLVP